jgi:hypothetical protein|tara:strand:- start:211 stop:396 length:186 start_codon:yes stop_codon:yes gene_type:complete
MVERKAKIDGDYRYWLYRKWDGKDKWLANSNRKCLFICINPNTADNNDAILRYNPIYKPFG